MPRRDFRSELATDGAAIFVERDHDLAKRNALHNSRTNREGHRRVSYGDVLHPAWE